MLIQFQLPFNIMPAKKTTKKVAAKKTLIKKAAIKKPTVKKTATKVPVKKASNKPALDTVTKAAYLNYRRRIEMGLPGDHDSDWHEAERTLTKS